MITRPLIVPVAIPGKVSFHVTFEVSPPLPTTDPLPMIVAALTPQMRVMLATRAHDMSLFVFVHIFVRIKK